MARYVANSRENLLYALSAFHLRCIALSRCRGSDFVAPSPSAPAAPCRPYGTSRPFGSQRPPAKNDPLVPLAARGALGCDRLRSALGHPTHLRGEGGGDEPVAALERC